VTIWVSDLNLIPLAVLDCRRTILTGWQSYIPDSKLVFNCVILISAPLVELAKLTRNNAYFSYN